MRPANVYEFQESLLNLGQEELKSVEFVLQEMPSCMCHFWQQEKKLV